MHSGALEWEAEGSEKAEAIKAQGADFLSSGDCLLSVRHKLP